MSSCSSISSSSLSTREVDRGILRLCDRLFEIIYLKEKKKNLEFVKVNMGIFKTTNGLQGFYLAWGLDTPAGSYLSSRTATSLRRMDKEAEERSLKMHPFSF